MKSNQSIANQICKYMQYIYLILFAGITIRYYLYSTVLEYNYPNALYLGLRYALMAYVLISIAFAVWQKQYDTVLEPVFMGLILVSAGIVTYVVKDNAVFDFALLLVGAKNVPWKRIAYVCSGSYSGNCILCGNNRNYCRYCVAVRQRNQTFTGN